MSRPRLLVVDDHHVLREALVGLLEQAGFEVVGQACDGADAVALAKQLAPEVVVMDLRMPVLDGVQATEQIREFDPKACVLMLTGSNARADVDRARRAGAAGYVTKDRIAAELIDAIIEVAGR